MLTLGFSYMSITTPIAHPTYRKSFIDMSTNIHSPEVVSRLNLECRSMQSKLFGVTWPHRRTARGEEDGPACVGAAGSAILQANG